MPPGPLIVLITGIPAGAEIFLIRIRFCCLCLQEPMTYEKADVTTNKKIITTPNLKQKNVYISFNTLSDVSFWQEYKVFCTEHPHSLVIFFVLSLLSKTVHIYKKLYFYSFRLGHATVLYILQCSYHSPSMQLFIMFYQRMS